MADASAATGSDRVLHLCMLLMLVMGTINMVLLKYQHLQKVPMYPGGAPVPFDQPLLQAFLMMVGEALCMPFSYCRAAEVPAEKKAPSWVFLVPCLCDLTATTLVCAGLAYIAMSVAQMCRGTVVIFVCVMSVVFLRRRQLSYHLFGVGLVTLGIMIVSGSAYYGHSQTGDSGVSSYQLGMGIFLCIFAQIFQAGMFVYEEKIMKQYTVMPLEVVGKEGLWGICVSLALLLLLNLLGAHNTQGALHQIFSSRLLLSTLIASMLAVALFNFAGATVTQRSSATARTTIKISSTICIWMVELAAGWNTFSFAQFSGFCLVAGGTLLYNRILVVPFLDVAEEQGFAAAKLGRSSFSSEAKAVNEA
eukprot:TRINITY_DN10524_c0_g2_i1.p1 TRINITY_DN10524_c0_g2~~TRINITY_DN10524_c0_g2_i1.p1  ORF type:complete len:362 (+),score=89.56 TRINITY_DN10524_c0_g2_i1:82-1167(+)